MRREKAEKRVTILTNLKTGERAAFGSQAKAAAWLGKSDNYISSCLKMQRVAVNGMTDELFSIKVFNRIYACYKGEELAIMGTKEEIKKHFGIDDKKFFWHKSPAANRRAKKNALVICEALEVDDYLNEE